MNYLVYARKSTEDEERQQLSIPAQIEELKRFAKQNQLNVQNILIETKSAKTPGRKVFNQMLNQIEIGESHGILCWHPDRLARNAVDAGQIVHLLDTQKLKKLKFVSFWFENTPQGIFMLNMAFSQSQYFSDNLAVNTIRGLRQKARMGYMPGIAPRGYQNDKLTKTMVVNPQVAPFIKQIYKLYSTGKFTLEKLAITMKKKGLVSPYGKPLRKDAITRILTNPFYYGYFIYKDKLYKGKHQPLVSKKLFDQVQAIHSSRSWKRTTNRPKQWPFTNLIRCGHCHMMVTAELQRKHYQHGGKQRFIYYHCTRKNKQLNCRQPFIRQPELNQQLSKLIASVHMPKTMATWFLEKIKAERQQKQVIVDKLQNSLEQKTKTIDDQLDRLLKLFLEGDIDQDQHRQQRKLLLTKKRQFESKLISLHQAPDQWLEPMEDWIKLAVKAKKIASLKQNLGEKRSFLQKSGSNLTLKDRKVCCIWPIPWARLSSRPTGRSFVGVLGLEPNLSP